MIRYEKMSGTHMYSGAMQDGRFGTLYAPSCTLNDRIRADTKIASWDSNAYREYMVANGLTLERKRMQAQPCGTFACSDLGANIVDPVPVTTDKVIAYEPVPSYSSPESQ